jgi:hypothetical protein
MDHLYYSSAGWVESTRFTTSTRRFAFTRRPSLNGMDGPPSRGFGLDRVPGPRIWCLMTWLAV